jgi:uncharacterized protein (TIGR02246 family)
MEEAMLGEMIGEASGTATSIEVVSVEQGSPKAGRRNEMAQHDTGSGARLESLHDAPGLFERLFNDGDSEGFASLFEPEAVLVHEPGQQAVGKAAIRDALAELMRGNPTITIKRRSAQQSGDLVLAMYDWTITGTGPEGDVLNMGGRGAIVFRRQPDGAWLAVFDNLLAGE